MTKYEPSQIEPKWIKFWDKKELYKAKDLDKKPKKYLLIEFPYPSGERLHVGHGRSYCCLDAMARLSRMKGFNVLYPLGWDAFGLPAENYAIKTGINPAVTTKQNIANAKAQAKSWGLSFDWSREIDTTDPNYYKWTQWIFLQLFKKGLAYQSDIAVNWCPKCKTNLADEEVLADGTHERCGCQTERRKQKQWLIKITAYAEKLLDDLKLVNYREDIAKQQINWIGKKEGIEINYQIINSQYPIKAFTTRPDTMFGATFIVLSPEHPLASKITTSEYTNNVYKYIETAKNKSELERISEGKKKTGAFTGAYAINPLNNQKLPIYISDFVLMSFGTGAVVGVPGHDKRDFEFAKEFKLPIVRVVTGKDDDTSAITEIDQVQEEEGKIVNSDFLDGLGVNEAMKRVMDYLEEKGIGKRSISYHLRDWVFSRQHYWGEPIPIIHCPKCGAVPVPEDQLPVKLPYLEKYQPSGTGESPLARVTDWVNTKCPVCGGPAKRETDTMPNWAGSNWYFIRYLDPKNDKAICDPEKLKYWMPVDLYNGGMEHTTLHLLYSRFIYKFLFNIGAVPGPEPYAKRWSHGVILGPDNQKMSKSRGNVINPDEIVKKYGADTFRLYEAFIGPFEQMAAWEENGVIGCYRFLNRVWELVNYIIQNQSNSLANAQSDKLIISLSKSAKKVENDIWHLSFNTAIASLMELMNDFYANKEKLSLNLVKDYLLLLAPFAPFTAEELWQKISQVDILSNDYDSVHQQAWPTYDEKLLIDKEVTIAIQINGKLRDVIRIMNNESRIKEKVEELARNREKVAQLLKGKKIIKVIYVPGRLINFVID